MPLDIAEIPPFARRVRIATSESVFFSSSRAAVAGVPASERRLVDDAAIGS